MATEPADVVIPPSQRITDQIAGLTDWRGPMLARLRALILEAAPGIEEGWKWDTGVWSQNGMVCSAGAFKNHVKLNFFRGAALDDPAGLFNAGLEAKMTRSIDIVEGELLDEGKLKDLVQAAVALNRSAAKQR